jgi:hypothetical protein
MKYLTIICLLSVLGTWKIQGGNQQGLTKSHDSPIIWDSTTNWKIYPLDNFNRIWQMPIDSLKYLKSQPLGTDSMHIFLAGITDLQDKKPIWMGCYLTSLQMPDGQVRKVLISHYAGFLYCEWDKSYHIIESSQLKPWLEYLSAAYISIETESTKP